MTTAAHPLRREGPVQERNDRPFVSSRDSRVYVRFTIWPISNSRARGQSAFGEASTRAARLQEKGQNRSNISYCFPSASGDPLIGVSPASAPCWSSAQVRAQRFAYSKPFGLHPGYPRTHHRGLLQFLKQSYRTLCENLKNNSLRG
jgi:hypothetical protein